MTTTNQNVVPAVQEMPVSKEMTEAEALLFAAWVRANEADPKYHEFLARSDDGRKE
jgi:hypothetical protein